jgi:hypothetical protein
VKNKGPLLFVLIAAAIVLVDLSLFQVNISAFWWHVRHGFHREVHGVRFRIPLFYEESASSVMNEFSICTFRTPIHTKSSLITVAFPPWVARGPSGLLSTDDASRIGLAPLRERRARFGDRTGSCAEYLQQRLVLNGASGPKDLDFLYIRCQFGEDLTATFDGTRNAIPEFYAFMEAAEEVKH